MNKRIVSGVLLGGVLLALGGCNHAGSAVACTAESAQEPVVGIVKDQLEQSVAAAMRKGDESKPVGMSKVRAAVAQLVVAIEDIRTSKEDPNSTKRFCTGTLKIRFPADMLSDADKARQASGLSTVGDFADQQDVERQADSFTNAIDFDVQPTDDGSKVFAETDSGNRLFAFASEVIASSLLRSSIEDAQRAQQAAADAQTAAQNAATADQLQANLEAAKTDNQLAVQTIGATWQALSPDTRQRLLPVQRAWIHKKDADCAVEAASASVDPNQRVLARLQCDTRTTQERTQWLGQYRNDNTAGQLTTAPDASTKPGGDDL